jgi:hypothetical protein
LDEKGTKTTNECSEIISLLASALTKMTNCYKRLGFDEKSYREMLSDLGADRELIKVASELARHFDIESQVFRPRYHRMKRILTDNTERWEEFLLAMSDFEPNKKGVKGGLKIFSDELRQEWNQLVLILDKFKSLRLKKPKSNADKEKLQMLAKEIPPEIRKRWKSGSKGLALEWMESYYPCKKTTLNQIISQAS